MKPITEIQKLRDLERQCQHLRECLSIARPGEIIFEAPQSRWSDNDIVVEADGVGGAKLLIVEGNYPIDYSIKSERIFGSEDAACAAAERLADRRP
jgi:hypothetical protein